MIWDLEEVSLFLFKIWNSNMIRRALIELTLIKIHYFFLCLASEYLVLLK